MELGVRRQARQARMVSRARSNSGDGSANPRSRPSMPSVECARWKEPPLEAVALVGLEVSDSRIQDRHLQAIHTGDGYAELAKELKQPHKHIWISFSLVENV